MRVIDVRTGLELPVGRRVHFGHGEWMEVLEVQSGILEASAHIRSHQRDENRARVIPMADGGGILEMSTAPFVDRDHWVPLHVRWTHPSFFLQHIGFVPS